MPMNIDRVPKNLDEAIEMIVESMDESEKAKIRREGFDPLHHHFGVGIWMRNNWSLWDEETPFSRWFRSKGIFHADDMSGIITKSVVRHLRGEAIDLDGQVVYYRNYWTRQGIDPDTGERMKLLCRCFAASRRGSAKSTSVRMNETLLRGRFG
ncbi:MAG: hypothetical protein HC888_04825 [Candidatus Competibacteraceae bacterium]|nr:hypothetical protein [Candidatus Competibacteraceae bacterium]